MPTFFAENKIAIKNYIVPHELYIYEELQPAITTLQPSNIKNAWVYFLFLAL